jgi:hypothetical protein
VKQGDSSKLWLIKPCLLFIAVLVLLSGCAGDDHDGRYPESRPVSPPTAPTPPPPRSEVPHGKGLASVVIGANSQISIKHCLCLSSERESRNIFGENCLAPPDPGLFKSHSIICYMKPPVVQYTRKLKTLI